MRVMQIIAFALIQGVLVFGVIAYFVSNPQPNRAPIISYMGVGMAVLMAFLQLIVKPRAKRSMLPKGVEAANVDSRSDEIFMSFAPRYQTIFIIRMALLEGAAFFNGAAYIVEGEVFSLVAMGGLVFLMLIQFPTRAHIENWIKHWIETKLAWDT